MSQFFIYLGVAFVASLIGSLQLGTVNLAVLATANNKGRLAAIYLAIGGCLPELLYAFFAFSGVQLLAQFNGLIVVIQLLMALVLFAVGCFQLFKTQVQPIRQSAYKSASFFKGLMLASLNPQLIVFWSAVLVYVNGFFGAGHTAVLFDQIGFALGAALGALCLLMLVAIYAEKLLSILGKINGFTVNRISGTMLIVAGLIQLWVVIF